MKNKLLEVYAQKLSPEKRMVLLRQLQELKGTGLPKAGSHLEEIFVLQMRLYGIPTPIREHEFHPERRWRFDFAWVHLKVAVEIEGGVSSPRGRHTQLDGFVKDAEKYAIATEMGWRVFRYPAALINNEFAIKQIARVLGVKP
ncbi:endonuclease domain-containing protein [Deinococcus cellulosilyticus]|uniref:DUF559 domain-containing protein n=1 Tax=Deinococcus cellulosilyticus (strain DSM 18568 / NBRC 106333 / KACC 11606 / 5516J-15) TaxID=1223518 RepID=A0A511N0P7_DEIC1|nr:endonuclease domain-containing protein [Deinococcus cellulosilyticus]GEM46027.1 hypothetical protein DC3_16620 [Deinococcus cellulosilyticus NBRC 106333 = KACC 11606]